MDKSIHSPNKINLTSARSKAVAIVMGVACLTGCSQEANDPDAKTISVDKSTIPTLESPTTTSIPFQSDGNCEIGTNTVGIGSDQPTTVEELAENYVRYVGRESGQDLSDCTDEVIETIIDHPGNRVVGANSPDSQVQTIPVMPADITRR